MYVLGDLVIIIFVYMYLLHISYCYLTYTVYLCHSMLVEELTLSLDEEREQVTALKRKHANNIRDMQRQIQLYSK